MALREAFIREHIARWERSLSNLYHPHRAGWPSRLFHHAPLENAVQILQSGFLRSRNDPENQRSRDVAAPGIIEARPDAHNYVRLYFRPKTPTQFHIEGIRKPGECALGEATHAPILVMFVLDAFSVLKRPDVLFSDQNMQTHAAVALSTESHFSSIPFDKVYHEGGYTDSSIKHHRCAEVLTPSPLPLREVLSEIWFRSEPERDTVLHYLGADREIWSGRCQVSDALKVFEKKYTFVEEIRLTEEGVLFSLNHRWDREKINIKIEVVDQTGQRIIDFQHDAHDAKPTTSGRFIYRRPLSEGQYKVEVHLEGQLAFLGSMDVGNTLF